MKRNVLKLTPALIKRIIKEEKQKILLEKVEKKKKRMTKQQIVESIKKLMLLKKAQKRAGKDFQNIYEQRERIKKMIKEHYNVRN